MLGLIKRGYQWATMNFQMLLLVGGLLCATAVGAGLWGISIGKKLVTNEVNEQTIKDVQIGQTKELIIMRKPKVEVQNILEAKWCRDCS